MTRPRSTHFVDTKMRVSGRSGLSVQARASRTDCRRTVRHFGAEYQAACFRALRRGTLYANAIRLYIGDQHCRVCWHTTAGARRLGVCSY